ncbi:ribbon-helix-helix domain-containing protein [Synechococcus sp. LTW-G]
MRTTLSLDDDVLAAAKVLARQRKQPIGSVISERARQGLAQANRQNPETAQIKRNGLMVIPRRLDGSSVDLELVNNLRGCWS